VHVLLGIWNQNSNTVIYEKCCSYLSISIFMQGQKLLSCTTRNDFPAHAGIFFIPPQILRHAQKQWFFILLGKIALFWFTVYKSKEKRMPLFTFPFIGIEYFYKKIFPYLHYPLISPIPISLLLNH